jgi:hypothetical protein
MTQPSKKSNDKALSQLSRQLLARWAILREYNSKSTLDLFKIFDLTGLDYKGQLSSGYGERGIKGEIEAGVNFGDLILPGFVTAEVKAMVAGHRTDYTLLLVLRHPRVLYEDSDDKKPIWMTDCPLSLVRLQGHSSKINVEVEASAGITINQDIDELGLKIDVGAEASVNAGISGQVMRLQDQRLRFYPPGSSDRSLAEDFFSIMDVLTRHQVKNMIQEWLNEHLKKLDEFKEEIQERTENILITKLKKILENIVTVETTVIDKAKGAIQPPKTAPLLNQLEALEQQILDQLPVEKKGPEKLNLIQLYDQVQGYRQVLEKLQSEKTSRIKKQREIKTKSSVRRKKTNSCHFNLFVIDGGAGANAQLKVILKKGKGGSDTKAEAVVAGSARRFLYRLQTVASGKPKTLIITQDTTLNYRDVNAKAYIKGGGSLDLPKDFTTEDDGKIERANEKQFIYRTLTYCSAVMYWFYPKNKNRARILINPGSGICFGMGVQVSRLINLANELDLKRKKSIDEIGIGQKELLNNISKQLYVSPEKLEDFLIKSPLSDSDLTQFMDDVFLLEAGFGLPPSVFRIKFKKKEPYEIPDMLTNKKIKDLVDGLKNEANAANKNDKKKEGLGLKNIRLRFRKGNNIDRNSTIFKLGFSFVAKVEVDIERVKASGHEGVIDLFTWFNKEEHNSDPIEGQERAVPPVAMLHN